MKTWFLTLLFTLSGASTALALDIINEDQRLYTVEIKSASLTKTLNLRARTRQLIVCVDTCEIHIPGVGHATVRGHDKLTVSFGRIRHEKSAPTQP